MGNSNPKQDLTDDLTVVGRNAVVELLKGGRQVECVYICDDTPARGQPISRIVAMAKDAGVPVKKVDAKKLDNLSNGLSHQGVVARGRLPIQHPFGYLCESGGRSALHHHCGCDRGPAQPRRDHPHR